MKLQILNLSGIKSTLSTSWDATSIVSISFILAPIQSSNTPFSFTSSFLEDKQEVNIESFDRLGTTESNHLHVLSGRQLTHF